MPAPATPYTKQTFTATPWINASKSSTVSNLGVIMNDTARLMNDTVATMNDSITTPGQTQPTAWTKT